jgi:tetratricopeptide (TPR) repeat protein
MSRFRIRMALSIILIAVTTFIALYALNQTPQSRSDWQVERGFYLQRQQDWEGALAAFTRAIEINPDNAGARNERARLYRRLGNYAAAIADLNYVIALYPTHADLYALRGEVYAESGDHPSAIADFTRALDLRPHYALMLLNRAQSYEALGNSPAAHVDYTAFLAIYDATDDRRALATERLAALEAQSLASPAQSDDH